MGCIWIYLKLRKYCNFGRKKSFQRKRLIACAILVRGPRRETPFSRFRGNRNGREPRGTLSFYKRLASSGLVLTWLDATPRWKMRSGFGKLVRVGSLEPPPPFVYFQNTIFDEILCSTRDHGEINSRGNKIIDPGYGRTRGQKDKILCVNDTQWRKLSKCY